MTSFQETLNAIRDARSRRELWSIALGYYRNHGIDKVSYHSADTQLHKGGVRADGFPEDWVCHYIGDGLSKVDPIPGLAARMTAPFHWSEAASLAEMTPENTAYLAELADSIPGDGLAFTAFGPRLRNAYIGLGYDSPRFHPSSQLVLEFQTVAQMGHLRWCQFSDDEETPLARLSPREQQTLELAAQGKSNSVIADILGISPHTVDTLMRRTYDKLGVADRTSAAIKALGSGLVQFSVT
ncbi:MAG: LuxR family transcriptional regulator [Pseudomonadota bacterium]